MSDLSSINKDRRLYVLKCGAGYTCAGFDYLNDQAVKLLGWLKENGRAAELLLGNKGIDVESLSIPARKGTKKHYAACNKIIDAARFFAVNTGIRCDAFLIDQLRGLERKRVEVVDCYGEKRRFWVGVSTGWMKAHLEILTRRSTGGASVYGAPFKSVRVVGA